MASKPETPTNRKGSIPIVYDSGRKRYRLTIYNDGTKKRTFHKTEEDALRAWRAYCRKLEKYGKQAGDYDAVAHREYDEAKRLCNGADLRDVAREWMSLRPSTNLVITVSEALKQFIIQKDDHNRSKRHQDTLKSHLTRFAAEFGERDAHSVGGNDVMVWLGELDVAPRTVVNYQRSLSNFFNWAERRGIVNKSPTASIDESDMPTVPKPSKGVLTVDQTAAMMTWLELERPDFVACHALQCFAGIRAAEIERMQWDWIDVNNKIITLPGWFWDADSEAHVQGTKTQDDWVLHDLPDNLWGWLKKYKANGKLKSPANKSNALMRQGFASLSFPIPKWPHNAMRHTFCTMAISLYQSADKVSLWSRHTNTRQLYGSYVAKLVSKAEAERYFAIVPSISTVS